MAYALTYDSLVEDIKNYTERNSQSFVALIPTFIGLAIERITNDLNNANATNLGSKVFATFENPPTLVAGQSVYRKPADWRMTTYIGIGGDKDTLEPSSYWNRLKILPYESIRQNAPDSSILGFPEFYSDYSYGTWLIAPTPNANYPAEIAYLQKFTPIDETQQSNWLTQFAPEVLLKQCLAQATIKTQNKDMYAMYTQEYMTALGALTNQNQGRLYDESNNLKVK